MAEIGERLGRYRIMELLGRGGLARVYRVRHEALGSQHALKLLTVPSETLAERLRQEGRIQARLVHPNVVSVTDLVDEDGQIGLVMEYVEGFDLEACLADGGMAPDDALDIFAQVLSGVAGAHSVGVLHRDLKPANVLLTAQGEHVLAKVADFGIARLLDERTDGRLTRQGTTMGTPGYMAPEQIEDAGGVDLRADVFALGALLYEMLSGERAFRGDALDELLASTLAGRYQPLDRVVPSCPPHLVAAVHRALSRDRQQRFADCLELAAALGLSDRLVPVRGQTSLEPAASVRGTLLSQPPPAPRPPVRQAPAAATPPEQRTTAETLAPLTLAGLPVEGAPTSPTLVAPDEVRPTLAPKDTWVDDAATDPPPAPAPPRPPAPTPPKPGVYNFDPDPAPVAPAPAEDEEDAEKLLSEADAVADALAKEARGMLWTFLVALGKMAKFLAGPAAGAVALALALGWVGAEDVRKAADHAESRRQTLSSAMLGEAELVRELASQGADVTALQERVRQLELSTDFDERRRLSTEIVELGRARFRSLPPSDALEDAQARRNLELKLNALERAHDEYDDARADWEAAASGVSGRVATRIGMAEAPN